MRRNNGKPWYSKCDSRGRTDHTAATVLHCHRDNTTDTAAHTNSIYSIQIYETSYEWFYCHCSDYLQPQLTPEGSLKCSVSASVALTYTPRSQKHPPICSNKVVNCKSIQITNCPLPWLNATSVRAILPWPTLDQWPMANWWCACNLLTITHKTFTILTALCQWLPGWAGTRRTTHTHEEKEKWFTQTT